MEWRGPTLPVHQVGSAGNAIRHCERLRSRAVAGRDDELTGEVEPPEAPSELGPGATLGRYLVLEKLGAGGMGVVYAAYDAQLHRKVAIKLLHADGRREGSASTDGQSRLLREAQALAQLSHPNVVAVHDVGRFEGSVFMAMEFVEGKNLREWMQEAPRGWREVLKVMLEAGRGLAAAHAVGLIHRDFKPDNVLLSRDGRVFVLDFGLVRQGAGMELGAERFPAGMEETASSPDALAAPLTRAGSVMGTRPYMAPELFTGGTGDERSDLFAFCVSLYEGLYGERPFAKALPGPRAWRTPVPPKEPRIPAWVSREVLRGLSVQPEGRQATLQALLDALAADPTARRRRAFAVGAGVALVLASVGTASVVVSRRGQLCKAEGARLAGTWDDAAKSALRKAFAASGHPDEEGLWGRTRPVLDAYARAWVEMRTQACTATRIEGSQSDEVLSLRMECLDRRLAGFKATVDIIAALEGEKLEKAAGLAARLTLLEDCANVQALRAPVAPPEDPAARAHVQALRRRFEEATALERAGEFKRALAIAQEAVKEAEGLQYRPLEAELLTLLGSNENQLGDSKRSAETLQRAITAAIAGKHPRQLANASVVLAWTDYYLDRNAEGRMWVDIGRAALEAIGGDPATEMDLIGGLAAISDNEKRHDEAVKLTAQEVAIAERLYGPEHFLMMLHYSNHGAALARVRQYEPAAANLKRSIALFEKHFGSNHTSAAFPLRKLAELMMDERGPSPEAEQYLQRARALREAKLGTQSEHYAWVVQSYAKLYDLRGQYARAEEQAEKAREIFEKVGGPSDGSTLEALSAVGELQRKRGAVAQALEVAQKVLRGRLAEQPTNPEAVGYAQHFVALALEAAGRRAQALGAHQQALAAWEGAQGPESELVGLGSRALGEWTLAEGRAQEALPLLDKALAIAEKRFGPQHLRLCEYLVARGRALQKLRRLADAKADLTRAVALFDAAPRAPELGGEARFLLAQVETDAVRARALAQEAQASFARSEAGTKERQLREVRAWLARR